MHSRNNLLILLDDISTCWNPERFSQSRYPQYVGTIQHKQAFSSTKVSCLDMVLKQPFQALKNPYSDRGVIEFIDRCVAFEKRINPYWHRYYTYLTIDQRMVKAGFTHRREGIHFDGMQGSPIPKKCQYAIPILPQILCRLASTPNHFWPHTSVKPTTIGTLILNSKPNPTLFSIPQNLIFF